MSNGEICDTNRLPLGLSEFSNIREKNKIYVDKTKLIYKIARQDSPVFIVRPRRFGKSLLINTLACLFSNGLEYFKGLDIEKMWNDKTYQVVHLDFSGIANKNYQDFKNALGETIIEEFCMKDSISQFNIQGARDPDRILNEIAKKLKNNSVVLLVDEYDAPLTHHINEHEELHKIISILNDFYATIKQYTDKFRLIFITGITRTSHVSIFSAFNNLKDLSLRDEYNSLFGFTQNELEKYFDSFINRASTLLNMKKEDVYKRIKQYYDGFQFSFDAKENLYNPWSILNFLDSPEEGFTNYWFESGGVSSIIMQYLKTKDYFDIINYKDKKISRTKKELSERYEINNIPTEILLFQAGYFTIRKETNQTTRLIFPNTEVEDSILDLYLVSNNLRFSDHVQTKLDNLSAYIDQKNLFSIIDIFNDILNDCVSILSKIFQDERSVRDIIYAALPQEIYLQKIKERETVKGFSDLELLTSKTHMVIEFKRTTIDRDARASLAEAIEQIRRKNYGQGAFQNHILYRVAMVISTEEKAILPNYSEEVL